MPQLSDIAAVNLGFKSLLNDFFYVTKQTVDRFGIEDDFLKPIHKLGDLDADRYFQRGTAKRWFFHCDKGAGDLAGTGALDYIQWGATQETRPRKQTERAVPWPDAPALSHSKRWYSPAAKVNLTRIAIRKAPGQRLAPFLFEKDALVDQRLYILSPAKSVSWELLAAYLSSSFFPLALEVHSNLSLGSGYLTLGANALRRLPVLDMAAVAKHPASQDVVDAAKELWKTVPPDASEIPSRKEVGRLDEAILSCLGKKTGLAVAVASDVAHFAETRLRLNLLRKTDSASASKADIEAVAEDLLPEVRAWLLGRLFPDDFLTSGTEAIDLSFSSKPLVATVEPLLDQATVEVRNSGGGVEYSGELPLMAAEVLLRALQLGRRQLKVPVDPSEAARVLHKGEELAYDLEAKFSEVMSTASLGSKHEPKVRALVLDMLGVRLDDLFVPVAQGEWRLPAVGSKK